MPRKLMTQARRHKAQQKAIEATVTSGCPCKLRGRVGKEASEEIQSDTKLIFEWCHIRTLTDDPYTVQILYRKLLLDGRAVPNC